MTRKLKNKTWQIVYKSPWVKLFLTSCTYLLIWLNKLYNSDFTCFSVYVCDMRINKKTY